MTIAKIRLILPPLTPKGNHYRFYFKLCQSFFMGENLPTDSVRTGLAPVKEITPLNFLIVTSKINL
jgi:hypothetical protein